MKINMSLDQQELYLLLGAALRYSLPRYSYIAPTIAEIISAHKGSLESDMLRSYLSDIERHLDENSLTELFSAFDNEVWAVLAHDLIIEINTRGD